MHDLALHAGGWAATGWWPLVPIAWAVFWTVVVLGVVLVLTRSGGRWSPRPSGAAVLAERYARDEIDEEEYRQRLAVLRERSP